MDLSIPEPQRGEQRDRRSSRRTGLRANLITHLVGSVWLHNFMESTSSAAFLMRTTSALQYIVPVTGLFHVFQGDQPVVGLPLLVGKLSFGSREELLVQVRCFFDLMEFVVRRSR